MVAYKGMKNNKCEIGDLLWCHFHKNQNRITKRNALLFQAKRIKKLPHNITQSEQDQFNLYNKWPEFKYVTPGSLSKIKIKRKIYPSKPGRGQYLTIDENNPGIYGIPNTYPFHTCMSQNPLVSNQDLGKEITDLLDFKSGNYFNSYKASRNTKNWSRVIWDLITALSRAKYTLQKSGYINHPRISKFILQNQKDFLMYSKDMDINLNDILPNEDGNFVDDENIGTSTIIMISEEKKYNHWRD